MLDCRSALQTFMQEQEMDLNPVLRRIVPLTSANHRCQCCTDVKSSHYLHK